VLHEVFRFQRQQRPGYRFEIVDEVYVGKAEARPQLLPVDHPITVGESTKLAVHYPSDIKQNAAAGTFLILTAH
jgi:hypothetical protein